MEGVVALARAKRAGACWPWTSSFFRARTNRWVDDETRMASGRTGCSSWCASATATSRARAVQARWSNSPWSGKC